MTAEEILAELETATAEVEEKGLKTVKVVNLKKFNALMRQLHDEDKKAGEVDHATRIEQLRAKLSDWLEERKREHESQLELTRVVVSSGQSALKTTLLINGGAAVALLAFVGHLVETTSSQISVRAIALAMAAFVGGVFAGAFATGLTYMNNLAASLDHFKTAITFNWFAIFFGLASLGLFCYGGYLAFDAIVS